MPYYDHDKDYPFAAFITNLGKYNEGELVGEWVKFPTTAEELKEDVETPCVIHPEAYSHRHCDYPLNRSIHGIGYGSLEQDLKA